MIKIFVLIMVVSGNSYDKREQATAVSITQEFNSLETCQIAIKSISSQVDRVMQSGCYQK